MAISILNYYEQPDGKNLMIMADDLYERNPGEAPDDNMPMDPTNYAISQNLGIPADGSITIVRDFDENKKVKTVTNVFKEGEWKDSTEGGGEIKTGYLNVAGMPGAYTYNPQQLILLLEENDMVVIKLEEHPTEEAYSIVGFSTNTNKQTITFAGGHETDSISVINPSEKINEEDQAKIVDLLKTKNLYPVVVEYT